MDEESELMQLVLQMRRLAARNDEILGLFEKGSKIYNKLCKSKCIDMEVDFIRLCLREKA